MRYFTLILIKKNHGNKSEKIFPKTVKICRDDYAKKYSNKVYIGMAVCKGRGDDKNTKLNIHIPIPTSFLHVNCNSSTNATIRTSLRKRVYRLSHVYVQLNTENVRDMQ